MTEATLLSQEPLIRAVCFFGILATMALWEIVSPCRPLSLPKAWRWGSNLGLVLLNTFLLRAVFPLAAVGFAAIAVNRNWGLLNQGDSPTWLTLLVAVIALDGVIYGQHVMFHRVPLLWRLHKVHHADGDFDVTTGLRFHPLEIFLSMAIKITAIAILGPSPLAVLIFEVLLNGTALFNHSNVSLPKPVDRFLRWWVVTPDMHRIHHSVIVEETNSNYGFNLPWWDRLFKTYRAHPTRGNRGMTIGLSEYQGTARVAQLPWLLWLPFQEPRQKQ